MVSLIGKEIEAVVVVGVLKRIEVIRERINKNGRLRIIREIHRVDDFEIVVDLAGLLREIVRNKRELQTVRNQRAQFLFVVARIFPQHFHFLFPKIQSSYPAYDTNAQSLYNYSK